MTISKKALTDHINKRIRILLDKSDAEVEKVRKECEYGHFADFEAVTQYAFAAARYSGAALSLEDVILDLENGRICENE